MAGTLAGIVLGGFRDSSILMEMTNEETTTEPIQQRSTRSSSSFSVSCRRSRIAGPALTQDLLPLVARVPGRDGVCVAAGFTGHGNVLGLMRGELAAAAILGRDDSLLELFTPARLLTLEPS